MWGEGGAHGMHGSESSVSGTAFTRMSFVYLSQ